MLIKFELRSSNFQISSCQTIFNMHIMKVYKGGETAQYLMRKLATLLATGGTFLALAVPAFAQAEVTGFDTSGIPFLNLGSLMSNILALLFFFAALLAFLFIIIGGIQWITAGGDKAAAQAARDRITAAVVGLLIVVASFAITMILSVVLGINLFDYQFPTAPQTAGT